MSNPVLDTGGEWAIFTDATPATTLQENNATSGVACLAAQTTSWH